MTPRQPDDLPGEIDADDVLVEAIDVSRTFGVGPTAVVAVHSVSCRLRAGDRVALTGPSGSGKTTLLHLLAGLDEPTCGRLSWPGIGPREHLRPGPVAVVFQGSSLLPPLDVVENVMLPLLLQGIPRARARARALAALDELGLGPLAAKLPEQLSGGQAQRVAIARVLADRPRVVFADEPTGQLDHGHGTLVVDALLAAAARTGAALVVNTHDPRVSERLDVTWAMASGRLDTDGRVRC